MQNNAIAVSASDKPKLAMGEQLLSFWQGAVSRPKGISSILC